jgi:hypothetical protein
MEPFGSGADTVVEIRPRTKPLQHPTGCKPFVQADNSQRKAPRSRFDCMGDLPNFCFREIDRSGAAKSNGSCEPREGQQLFPRRGEDQVNTGLSKKLPLIPG